MAQLNMKPSLLVLLLGLAVLGSANVAADDKDGWVLKLFFPPHPK